MELFSARQNKGESIQEFADRCRNLALKTVRKVDDLDQQRFHYKQADRMFLASFVSGLAGMPGKQVRYARPTTLSDAVKIALLNKPKCRTK
jgi:hypothetical protein